MERRAPRASRFPSRDPKWRHSSVWPTRNQAGDSAWRVADYARFALKSRRFEGKSLFLIIIIDSESVWLQSQIHGNDEDLQEHQVHPPRLRSYQRCRLPRGDGAG